MSGGTAMIETSMTVESGEVELAGTLARPESTTGSGPLPAALLIAGSGPLDRDGNHKRMKLNVSRDLAALLAANGWASLRIDKRGIGSSGGDYLSTGFYDEIADIEAALGWLQGRRDVGRIVAIGHSAGAMQAAELAANHAELVGAALLATSTQRGEDILRWQAANVAKQLVPRPIRALLRLLGTSVEARQAKALTKLRSTTTDVARIQLVKINAKWMREFLDYDPTVALGRARVPVLAITGTKDVQVDADDLDAVRRLVPAPVETLRVDDLDHVLRHESKPVSNPRRYVKQVENPIDGRVTSALLSWLDRLGDYEAFGSVAV